MSRLLSIPLRLYLLWGAWALFSPWGLAENGPRAPWWDPAWKERKVIRVLPPAFGGRKKAPEREGADPVPEDEDRPRGDAAFVPDPVKAAVDHGLAPEAQKIELDTARVYFYGEGRTLANGRDIQMIGPSGQPIPFQVVPTERPGYFWIDFQFQSSARDYYVYYANPSAPSSGSSKTWKPWPRAVRRLTAEVSFYPTTLDQAVKAFQETNAMQPPVWLPDMDMGHWRGGSLRGRCYVSLYEGYFATDRSGTYDFAVAAWGPSFLLIDNRLVLSTDEGRGSVRNWRVKSEMELRAGIHSLKFYHVHSYTRLGTRVGWRPPERSKFTPIPGSVFVNRVAAREIALERPDGPSPAFFSMEDPPSVIDLDRRSVAFVPLRNGSQPGVPADEVRYTWEFESGSRTQDVNPVHGFILDRPEKVTLKAFHGEKLLGEYSRTVSFPNPPLHEELNFSVELISCPTIVYRQEPTNLVFRVQNEMSAPFQVEYRVECTPAGKGPAMRVGTLPVGACDFSSALVPFSAADFQNARGHIALTVSLLDEKIHEEQFDILPWRDGIAHLRSQGDRLIGPSGSRTILVADLEDPSEYQRWATVKWAYRMADRTPKRVLVVGDPMTSWPEHAESPRNYASFLKEILSPREESFTFSPTSSSMKPVLQLLLSLPELLARNRPEIVVIVAGLGDVIRATPIRDFERGTDVMIDLIRSQDPPARVVLVSPPPLLSQIDQARHYRDVMKRVAADHHCTFLDLIEAFSKGQSEWREEFLTSPGDPSIRYLYPNESGQKRIAELIASKVH